MGAAGFAAQSRTQVRTRLWGAARRSARKSARGYAGLHAGLGSAGAPRRVWRVFNIAIYLCTSKDDHPHHPLASPTACGDSHALDAGASSRTLVDAHQKRRNLISLSRGAALVSCQEWGRASRSRVWKAGRQPPHARARWAVPHGGAFSSQFDIEYPGLPEDFDEYARHHESTGEGSSREGA